VFRSLWRRSEQSVRALVFAAALLFAIFLVTPKKFPYSLVVVAAGVLLLAAGVVAATDGGHAITSLSRRYASWQRPPNARIMAALILVIGVIWIGMGVAVSVR
jgi:4-amino-4-deoxy-L-arabinose transferase-like glycosyltransferase